MRLANASPPLLVGAAGIALAAALGAWGLALARGAVARALVPLAHAALMFAFLWGRLDEDSSRRIGLDTALGKVALALVGLAALGLAAFFFLGWPRVLWAWLPRSWRGALVPLALLALAPFALRSAFGQLGAYMDVRRVELELAGASWDVRRAHPDRTPGPGLLAPSAGYSEQGAARPAFVLPPPALVRATLAESETSLWLVGGAGLDHSTAEALERYRGHVLRVTARVDGAEVFATELALGDAPAWIELGAGAGLEVRGGAELELETALLDPSGREIAPADPLSVGFGGLALERRARVARARATREHPNIVLVLLDTLRADRTSAYGYARDTTPHLAALARRGLVFEEAHATASWTWPSTASILTGLLPEEHGVQDAASSFLSPALDTLAEALQRSGYTTAAWSGSPLIVPDKLFDQGFEFFDASRAGNMRRSDLLMPAALEWLGAASEWRFFLYLHLMEPHAPYVPLPEGRARFAPEVPTSFDPRRSLDHQWELLARGFDEHGVVHTERVVPPEEQRWISDLYDGCVWSADDWLGRLLQRLDQLGLTENTIVAVTSDHGEELFDHGLLAHAHALHRELVRVPLVLAGPGLPQGERIAVPVSGAALGPALARLGGATIEGLTDDFDLLQPGAGESVLFSTRQGYWNGVGRQPLFGLRQGTNVLHFAPRAAGRTGADAEGDLHLYDLARDPEEHDDLAVREPERARRLRDLLLERLATLESRRTETGGAVDGGTLEILRDLGYGGEEVHAPDPDDAR
jgi:arylsulfatase A-like enzyme